MARALRLILPDYPHHVVQRGHYGQTVFTDDRSFLHYLGNLRTLKEDIGCRVYAYCLMSNHVHLVVDPGERTESLSQLMKGLGGRQTKFMNWREGRVGTLWQGRYFSSPIDADEYLMACCRYVELNPVRAGLTDHPAAYRWSSYRCRTGLAPNDWLDPDPCFGRLDTPAKVAEYERWVSEGIPEKEETFIREAARRGRPTGGERFAEEIAEKLGVRLENRPRGRPRKAASVTQHPSQW